MRNKKLIACLSLFSIILAGCDNPFEQNYLDRKSKIETFLAYDGTPIYYVQRSAIGPCESFDDKNDYIINKIKANMPVEVNYEDYSEQDESKTRDDFNFVMISYTELNDSQNKYSFTLFGNYRSCEIEVSKRAIVSSQSSTRYYLLDEGIGKQIYDFTRKQLENPQV